MSNIYISSQELENSANQIRSLEQEVSGIFNQIHSQMNTVSAVWNSPASQSLQEQFQSLSPVFTQYLGQLENFARFLSQTATLYAENEASIQSSL